MSWRTIYRLPWEILRETPDILRSRGRALGIFFVAWMALLWFWHRFDYIATTWAHVHSDPFWLNVARLTSSWGELQRAPLLALIVLALIGFWRKVPQLYWAALSGALAGIAGGILVNIIKCIFGRPRPSTGIADGIYWFRFGWDHQSFPSGHATHCSAIATAVCLLAPRSGVGFAAGALFVMWSRWYSERHYVSDLWGGAGLGITIGLIFGFAARAVLESRGAQRQTQINKESHPC